jgi:uncharacterized repeat protein (TIGR04076 family)
VKTDQFTLKNLRLTIVGDEAGFVCSHTKGQYIDVVGENIYFTGSDKFSFYMLSAVLPLIAAKQRVTQPNDWMSTDDYIACPDPNCEAKLKITIIGKKQFNHSDTTKVTLNDD